MIRASFLLAAAMLMLAACDGKKEEEAAAPLTDEQRSTAVAMSSVLDDLKKGDSGEANPEMRGYAANLSKVADALAKVKDEASARAIGKQLQPIFKDMQKQVDAIEAMGKEKADIAAVAVAPQLVDAQNRIAVALSNWAMTKPELAEIVGQEVEKMPEIE